MQRYHSGNVFVNTVSHIFDEYGNRDNRYNRYKSLVYKIA